MNRDNSPLRSINSGKNAAASAEHSPGRNRIQQLSEKLNSIPYNAKDDTRCVITNKNRQGD